MLVIRDTVKDIFFYSFQKVYHNDGEKQKQILLQWNNDKPSPWDTGGRRLLYPRLSLSLFLSLSSADKPFGRRYAAPEYAHIYTNE